MKILSLSAALMVGTALTGFASLASAQTAPTPAPAPAPTRAPATTAQPAAPVQTPPAAAPQQAPADGQPANVETVEVTGRANDIRTSIDSISYSVAEDLQSATGTLADALRSVPSVEVDPDGNVTLRGDANVTILVDGRPSSLFEGQSRGQAVLQIPADQYARIEVMTNPSAAYRPDGSGGVINLISKPARVRPGATTTGSVRANIGDSGRYNLGGNFAWSRDALTLSGDVGVRHDTFVQETDRIRENLDVGSGRFLEARNTQDVEGASDSAFVRLSADYKLDDKTQLTGEVRYTEVDSDADAADIYDADNAAGGIGSAYRRFASGGFAGTFSGVTGRVVRRFDDQGHEWSNEIRYDRNRSGYAHDAYADGLIPVAPLAFEVVDNVTNGDNVGFSSAYTRPMPNNAKLRAGYELDSSKLELDNLVLRGPTMAALAPDTLVSNAFHIDQAVHALYATYERPFGKLTAQFGLRVEQALLDLDQVTTNIQSSNDYLRAYPTLHLSYELAADQTLRGSYSRRIQRPQPFDLNPFLSYQDPLSYRSGNPDLEPQETDSFELTWQRRIEQTFYQATLYYRDTTKAFTPVATDIGGGVLLYRPENLGARTATGLELVANGKLHPTLRYSASVNLFRQEIDAAGLVGAVDSSGTTVSGRLNLSWQPTPEDFLQVSTIWTGEQLQAQGAREATTLVNLGYRRKLTEKLSLQVTVRDLFDNYGDIVTLDTVTLRERTERVFGGRIAFIGLTWNFGQGQRRPEQFDFSAGQQGG